MYIHLSLSLSLSLCMYVYTYIYIYIYIYIHTFVLIVVTVIMIRRTIIIGDARGEHHPRQACGRCGDGGGRPRVRPGAGPPEPPGRAGGFMFLICPLFLLIGLYYCLLFVDWPGSTMTTSAVQAHIGERGITLSGGQRCRVALARAAFSGATLQVLDDPLAALDTHVARHVLRECILGAMRGATVVLATNQVDLVRQAVLESSAEASFLEMRPDGSVERTDRVVGRRPGAEGKEGDRDPGPPLAVAGSGPAVELVQAEDRARGDIPWSVYSTYFTAGGGWRIRALA